jgi:hypothetical protein
MIKIENVEVFGWDAAIRGMRNSMNSWNKSDSSYCYVKQNCEGCANLECLKRDDMYGGNAYSIGENDFELMKKLVKSGTDHSKFMRMINVTLDIIAPLYWWKEFDTYKVSSVRNSCSTMHKIADKKFTLDDFSHENLGESAIEEFLEPTIRGLNIARDMYLEKKSEGKESKSAWWQMIQLLPSSYNQRATVQLNYAVLRNMYHARKNHKLDEWKSFCKWIESLPYSELITG